jgi:hypothetical protein
LHDLADAFTQFQRPRRGDEAASCPHQQRIAGRLAQSRQRAAHRRLTEPQAPGRARNAAFREQHVEGDQQVEIGSRHPSTLAHRSGHGVKRMNKVQMVRLSPCRLKV